jgi:phage I-like protein
MQLNRGSHLVELVLADVAGGKKAPPLVVLVPRGKVKSTRGDFLCDDQAIQACIDAFKAEGVDLVIDYEHQTLGGDWAAPDGKAPAAGWIKEVMAHADGLVGRVFWNARAAALIESLEYRYLSPVTLVRAGDGRVVRIHSVGMTNNPAIVDMPALVNKDQPFNEEEKLMKARLVQMLALKDSATDDEVLGAVQRALDGSKTAERLGALRGDLVQVLALKDDVDDAGLKAKVVGLANAGSTVPVAEYKALKDRLDARDADDLVAKGVTEGKITPAFKDRFRTLALSDRACAEAFLKDAPVVVPQGTQAVGTATQRTGEGGLTAEELKVCKDLGLKPEDFKKHNEAAQ